MSQPAVAEPDVYERATALIEHLFEAPSSPRAWVGFLGALCREMSPDAVAVLIGQLGPERPPGMLAHGVDLRGISPDQALPMGPQPSEEQVPTGTVIAIEPGSETLAHTRLFQNILAKHGVQPAPGFSVVLGRNPQQITGALLVLSRDPGWRPRPDDRALLALLAPYVRRAILAGLLLNEHRTDEGILLGLLDALALGVVLLDHKSRVSFVNRSAAEILGTEAGLSPFEEAAGNPRGDDRSAALRALLRTRVAGPHEMALASPHPEDGRPLQIVSTPLQWPGAGPGVAARFASALFLGDPSLAARHPIEGLRALYGLTPAEDRLASLLAGGVSLAEAAEALGIRMGTARGVLKAVFAKTGTRRQASLVNLILAAPGQIRGSAPRGPIRRATRRR